MKVLLIRPPNRRMIRTNVPDWVDTGTGLYPPLGLMYVAAAAAEAGHEVSLLDAEAEDLDAQGIEARVRQRRAEVVGVQTLTFTLIDALRTAAAIKNVDPAIHVCLGGPHVNLFPEETLNLKAVDSIVLGEGEIGFPALLDQLERGDKPSAAPGIGFLDEGRPVLTAAPLLEDLDVLPKPERTMLPYERYHSVLAKERPITTMMSSRGCPCKCLFCDRPHLGKRFRSRSAGNIVDEMERCVELGIREIVFYDDTFTINRRRVHEICDAVIARGLEVGWDIRARVDTVDEECLRKLKRAGCRRIHFGIESGNPEILKVLRKGIDLEAALDVFRAARRAGITTLAYFMIGNPTETAEQIEETFRYAVKFNPDYAHIAVTTPFPGTDLHRLGLENGLYEKDHWREFAARPEEDFVPPLWTENFTRDELIEMLNKGYRKFYMRPRFLIRKVFDVRSPSELWRKAKLGLRMAVSR